MNIHPKEKLLILGLIACTLTVGLGFSFAYFLNSVGVQGDGATTNLKTVSMSHVVYDAGESALVMEDAIPGNSSSSKGFKITLSPAKNANGEVISTEVTYAIKMNITKNDFVKCTDANYDALTNDCEKDAQELTYRLKDSSGNVVTGGTGDLTGVTDSIVIAKETKTISAETDFNYTLEITFNDTNHDQNHNMSVEETGKVVEFKGNVIVEFAE